MESLEKVLREHAFLADLTDEHVRVLVGCARNTRFAPGEFLLREGDDESTFFLLRQGSVSLESHLPGKPAATVETLGPGDVLGVSWMFQGARSNVDARARDAVVAFALDGACLRAKTASDDALGHALARRMLEVTHRRLERLRLQNLDVYR
jgi:CRP/FNR family transcriptional regulator, cyclic AMP receptor protein